MSLKVKGYNFQSSFTPTISTSAYSANDQMGTLGTLTFGGNGTKELTLQTVVLTDKNAGVLSPIDILFFNVDPGLTSVDNGALSFPDSGLPGLQGFVSIAAADYKAFALNSAACIRNQGLKMNTDGLGRLFVVLRTTGTPTYTSTSDVSVYFEFYGD